MIARVWRGHVETRDADEYLALMRTVALPDCRSTPGNLGAYVLCRPGPSIVEFTVLTFWDCEEAVAGFTGDRPTRAKYYPFDPGFLLAMAPNAEHLDAYDE